MQEYIAIDDVSKEILNSAKLLQTVKVNALIIGFDGTGKKTLAKFILPFCQIYEASDLQKDFLENITLLEDKSIIVNSIEKLANIDSFLKWLNQNNVRLIATTNTNLQNLNQKLKDIFSVNIEIPNLIKRQKDTKALIQSFSKEASLVLDTPLIDESRLNCNLSKNAKSLRKSIYFSYLFESLGESEILMLMQIYISKNLNSENSYKDLSYVFEVPLLKASLKKYKSQVQVSKHLGINRITLRKKLEIYKDFL